MMDFWNTSDSATWYEESWSKEPHESLFESQGPLKKRQKKSKKHDSEDQVIREEEMHSTSEERIIDKNGEREDVVKRKRKGKKNDNDGVSTKKEEKIREVKKEKEGAEQRKRKKIQKSGGSDAVVDSCDGSLKKKMGRISEEKEEDAIQRKRKKKQVEEHKSDGNNNDTHDVRLKEERVAEDKGETEDAAKRKKKKKQVEKHKTDGNDNEVKSCKRPMNQGKSAISAASSEEIKEFGMEKGHIEMPKANNQENIQTVHMKKKRKRKPRNNKFKDKAKIEEDESTVIDSEMVINSDNISNNQDDKVNGSALDSSKSKLSGKERRKLRRKLAKQQMRKKRLEEQAMVEDKKSVKKTKKTEDLNSSLLEKPSKDHSESNDETEDKTPDLCAYDNTSSNLILAKTKRKTQMKPDVSLKSQMESQLKSSQFRFLNEQLYKVTGDEAKRLFAADGAAFLTYHEGFTQQVQQWPSNPVDIFIDFLKKRPVSLVVGDFGCGDAKIARSVKQKVHSFDLYPINKHVTVCDTKKVPLKDEILDVAVFCLSLMGTNWMDYIKEANRVLKNGGLLKVAEVASRFSSLASFLSVMKSLGFQLKTKDMSNKMFYLFDFKKKQVVTSIPAVKGPILKPCLYKKR